MPASCFFCKPYEIKITFLDLFGGYLGLQKIISAFHDLFIGSVAYSGSKSPLISARFL